MPRDAFALVHLLQAVVEEAESGHDWSPAPPQDQDGDIPQCRRRTQRTRMVMLPEARVEGHGVTDKHDSS